MPSVRTGVIRCDRMLGESGKHRTDRHSVFCCSLHSDAGTKVTSSRKLFAQFLGTGQNLGIRQFGMRRPKWSLLVKVVFVLSLTPLLIWWRKQEETKQTGVGLIEIKLRGEMKLCSSEIGC